MTISDQIRDAAIYAANVHRAAPHDAYYACVNFLHQLEWLDRLTDTDLRTFMLLVAEALE